MTVKNTNIVVVGGGPAGIVSAVAARKYYPDKKILVIKNVEEGVIPCGIPYMFASLNSPDENALTNTALEESNVDIVIDEVIRINRDVRMVYTKGNNEFHYEKLILALGSTPIILPIPGINKKGIYPVDKDMKYLKGVITEIKEAKNVVVLGGGFIGVEFADEISRINGVNPIRKNNNSRLTTVKTNRTVAPNLSNGVNVYLVELLPNLLANSFDPEFSKLAENRLAAKGVKILTNTRVEEFLGAEKVEKARLSNKEELDIDSAILGIGSVPNTKLAREAGLDLGKGKGIWVDEYMRTIDKDIFAVGDCAGKRDFYTRKDAPVMLASTATAEARIAGANLYQIKVVRENKGTIAIYSTYVDGLVMGSAGLTEESSKKENFEIVTGSIDGVDKHPSTMPGVNKIKVKLIFSKQSGIILGGQVAGGMSCGEMINIIGIAVQQRVSLTELETLQMATHPYLTAAPTIYPLVIAAQNAGKQI